MRRVADVVFALVVIILPLPFWALLALLLRCTGEGKVFYRQPRVGRAGEIFKLIKFASMLEDSPNLGTGDITVRNDPRVLPVGRLLRKTKLNEFPQAINLLKGDMTLVGPRPLTPKNFALYPDHVRDGVVTLKPGLTGIGSIVFRDEETIIANSGKDHLECYRTEIAPYKGELELWYIANRSLLLDSRIVLLTVWVVLFPKSRAYMKLLKGLPLPRRAVVGASR
jgi:lipopolysaccharide/colanic/teichoic acid biosynthesis glycosyltransferase